MVFRKFRFGKYKGKEICGIAMTHTGYILWLLENTQFKLNELEQECFDAVAKAKAEGSTNFVYNKEDLKKHIKDKGIKTPFVSREGFFGILKGCSDHKLVKIFRERYDNKEYDKIPVSTPRKGSYDSLASLQRSVSESDYDDPMNGLYGVDEVDEILNDASSMSAFLY
jgi:hypothetical protein|nr:MAG TPA: Putative quorum-sensing-regulated virulence factor [Caudoviricetes sp.]